MHSKTKVPSEMKTDLYALLLNILGPKQINNLPFYQSYAH